MSYGIIGSKSFKLFKSLINNEFYSVVKQTERSVPQTYIIFWVVLIISSIYENVSYVSPN